MVSILTSLVSSLEIADLCRRTALARSQIDKFDEKSIDEKHDPGKFIRKGPVHTICRTLPT
jgi:hypothetical protein